MLSGQINGTSTCSSEKLPLPCWGRHPNTHPLLFQAHLWARVRPEPGRRERREKK